MSTRSGLILSSSTNILYVHETVYQGANVTVYILHAYVLRPAIYVRTLVCKIKTHLFSCQKRSLAELLYSMIKVSRLMSHACSFLGNQEIQWYTLSYETQIFPLTMRLFFACLRGEHTDLYTTGFLLDEQYMCNPSNIADSNVMDFVVYKIYVYLNFELHYYSSRSTEKLICKLWDKLGRYL